MWNLRLGLFSGNFGSAIGSLFVFFRWVIFLNFCLSVLWFGFVVMPTAVHYPYDQVQGSFSIENVLDGKVNYSVLVTKQLMMGGFSGRPSKILKFMRCIFFLFLPSVYRTSKYSEIFQPCIFVGSFIFIVIDVNKPWVLLSPSEIECMAPTFLKVLTKCEGWYMGVPGWLIFVTSFVKQTFTKVIDELQWNFICIIRTDLVWQLTQTAVMWPWTDICGRALIFCDSCNFSLSLFYSQVVSGVRIRPLKSLVIPDFWARAAEKADTCCKGDYKEPSVYIDTNSCFMTCSMCDLHFKYIFGTIWPIVLEHYKTYQQN